MGYDRNIAFAIVVQNSGGINGGPLDGPLIAKFLDAPARHLDRRDPVSKERSVLVSGQRHAAACAQERHCRQSLLHRRAHHEFCRPPLAGPSSRAASSRQPAVRRGTLSERRREAFPGSPGVRTPAGEFCARRGGRRGEVRRRSASAACPWPRRCPTRLVGGRGRPRQQLRLGARPARPLGHGAVGRQHQSPLARIGSGSGSGSGNIIVTDIKLRTSTQRSPAAARPAQAEPRRASTSALSPSAMRSFSSWSPAMSAST